jgi:hypothetical protein
LNSEKHWKKSKLKCEKKVNTEAKQVELWNDMANLEKNKLEFKMIWKIWEKIKSNSEKIRKLWKKSNLKSEKDMGNMEEKYVE